MADMRLMNDLRNFGGPKSFLCAAVAAAVRLCLATQDHGFFAGAAALVVALEVRAVECV